MASELGRAALVAKGVYSLDATYHRLDLVTYNGGSYVAKSTTKGNAPTNTTYWQVIALAGTTSTDIAIADDGGYFSSANTEGALQEVGLAIAALHPVEPALGYRTVLAADKSESVYSGKQLFDAIAPASQYVGDASAVGAAMTAARRDHKHALADWEDISDKFAAYGAFTLDECRIYKLGRLITFSIVASGAGAFPNGSAVGFGAFAEGYRPLMNARSPASIHNANGTTQHGTYAEIEADGMISVWNGYTAALTRAYTHGMFVVA